VIRRRLWFWLGLAPLVLSCASVSFQDRQAAYTFRYREVTISNQPEQTIVISSDGALGYSYSELSSSGSERIRSSDREWKRVSEADRQALINAAIELCRHLGMSSRPPSRESLVGDSLEIACGRAWAAVDLRLAGPAVQSCVGEINGILERAYPKRFFRMKLPTEVAPDQALP
jgi:hypothetical protein